MSEKRNRRSFLASEEGVRNLIAAQDKTGYTHAQIAEKSSSNEVTVSPDSVKNLFNPRYNRKVGADIIRAIANILNLHPRDIAGSEWDSPVVTTKPKQVDSGINPPNDKNPADRLIVEPEPEDLVPLNSHFYIERHNVESLCYKTIKQPGSLTRITSTQGMGKTSLLGQSLEYAKQQNYETATLDLNLADRNILTNSNTFLYWFCVQVSNSLADIFDSLDLQSKIEECWQDTNTPKENCNRYIKSLLSNSECPIAIGIDNSDLLIEFYDTYEEFFPLLRFWHDSSKQKDRVGNIWRKLRVILVCSTQAYPKLPDNYSPFNVGVSVKLPDFNLSEVTTFAKEVGGWN